MTRVFLALALVVASARAYADDSKNSTIGSDAVDAALATEVDGLNGQRVPDNPALDLLGQNELAVSRPGSVTDLVTDVRALVKDGTITPQLAIEISPYSLFRGEPTIKEYREDDALRLLERFTLSIATTNTGDDDAKLTLGAIGARIRLVDNSDWRLSTTATKCALDAADLDKALENYPDKEGPREGSDLSEDVRRQVASCFADNRRWNSTQVAIGGALSSAFPNSVPRWDVNDAVGWFSASRGIGKRIAIIGSAKYLFNDVQLVDGERQAAQHTVAGSVKLEVRGAKLGLLFDAGVGGRWRRDEAEMEWSDELLGLFGGEAQLLVAKDTWLSVRFSTQIVDGSGDKAISLANFKWNYDLGGKGN